MSLGTTGNIFQKIGVQSLISTAEKDGLNYIDVMVSFIPTGKGSLEPDYDSLIYDSGSLGYLTINNVKSSQLLKLWKINVNSSGNYSNDGANDNVTIPSLENESSYIKISETLVFKFRMSIEKKGDIPATITIGTKELGETSFVIVIDGSLKKVRPYFSGEIDCTPDISLGNIEIEKNNTNLNYFLVSNPGDYNLDISSIVFQDTNGEVKDYVYITDQNGTAISSSTITAGSYQAFYVNFDARETNGRTNNWIESWSKPPIFENSLDLGIAGRNLDKNESTNNKEPSFKILLEKMKDENDFQNNFFNKNPKIVINSNCQINPKWSINIVDSCLVAPFLQVRTPNSSEINFEKVVEGTENYRELIIKNSGFQGDLIVSDISSDHTHTNTSDKLITTDFDFSSGNLTIAPGEESVVTIQFLNATYSDDTSLGESTYDLISKKLIIKSNAINAQIMNNGYGTTNGSYANNNGETNVAVFISIIPQVQSYFTQKYIRPSFDFKFYDCWDIGTSQNSGFIPSWWFIQNTSQTNYLDSEISYELYAENEESTHNNYHKVSLISYDDSPSNSKGNLTSTDNLRMTFVDPNNVSGATYNASTKDFTFPVKNNYGYSENVVVKINQLDSFDWNDKVNWNILVGLVQGDPNQSLQTINVTMNVRLNSTYEVIETFTRKLLIKTTESERSKPVANFTLDETEGLRYTSTQTPQKFNAKNISSFLQWWNMGATSSNSQSLLDYIGLTGSSVKAYWKLSLQEDGSDKTSDYSHWWTNVLTADQRTAFNNNQMFDLTDFYYDTKGNKKIQLIVEYIDDTTSSNTTRTSTAITKTVSIYDTYNSKMKISPRPYATLNPNFPSELSLSAGRSDQYTTKIVVYNTSNIPKILKAVVVEPKSKHDILIAGEKEFEWTYPISAISTTTIPINVIVKELENRKTFIKGYEEGKIKISLDDDLEYAIINIVGSQATKKQHFININGNYENRLSLTVLDHRYDSHNYEDDDIYLVAKMPKTHYARKLISLNFNSPGEE